MDLDLSDVSVVSVSNSAVGNPGGLGINPSSKGQPFSVAKRYLLS